MHRGEEHFSLLIIDHPADTKDGSAYGAGEEGAVGIVQFGVAAVCFNIHFVFFQMRVYVGIKLRIDRGEKYKRLDIDLAQVAPDAVAGVRRHPHQEIGSLTSVIGHCVWKRKWDIKTMTLPIHDHLEQSLSVGLVGNI